MSNKQSHLEMIQGVINRQSHNSFLLKGWAVILVSALFALGAKESQNLFVYLAFYPALAFWGLDGYFLGQERLFRLLYDYVREKNDEEIDFSMNVSELEKKAPSWASVTFSKTLLIFHGVVVLLIVCSSVFVLFKL